MIRKVKNYLELWREAHLESICHKCTVYICLISLEIKEIIGVPEHLERAIGMKLDKYLVVAFIHPSFTHSEELRVCTLFPRQERSRAYLKRKERKGQSTLHFRANCLFFIGRCETSTRREMGKLWAIRVLRRRHTRLHRQQNTVSGQRRRWTTRANAQTTAISMLCWWFYFCFLTFFLRYEKIHVVQQCEN